MEDDPISSSLRPLLSKIDALHRFSTIPPFPLVISKARNEQGSYHYTERPHRPQKIEISRHAICPIWTLSHEVGHLLDHCMLNPLRREFGSDHDPWFDDLLGIWKGTTPVVKLARRLTARRRLDPLARQTLRAYLTGRELWARTYAQWVAIKSQDATLLSHLENLRAEGAIIASEPFVLQWDDDEFADIMHAVDFLFRNARLM